MAVERTCDAYYLDTECRLCFVMKARYESTMFPAIELKRPADRLFNVEQSRLGAFIESVRKRPCGSVVQLVKAIGIMRLCSLPHLTLGQCLTRLMWSTPINPLCTYGGLSAAVIQLQATVARWDKSVGLLVAPTPSTA